MTAEVTLQIEQVVDVIGSINCAISNGDDICPIDWLERSKATLIEAMHQAGYELYEVESGHIPTLRRMEAP